MKRNISLIAFTALTLLASCKKEKTLSGNPALAVSPKIEWSKNWGGSMTDYGYASVTTPDGGIITAGATMSYDKDADGQRSTIGTGDTAAIKYNAAGEKQWQKLYGGTGHEEARAIINTANGGYLAAGSASSRDGDISGFKGQNDMWTLKIQAK